MNTAAAVLLFCLKTCSYSPYARTGTGALKYTCLTQGEHTQLIELTQISCSGTKNSEFRDKSTQSSGLNSKFVGPQVSHLSPHTATFFFFCPLHFFVFLIFLCRIILCCMLLFVTAEGLCCFFDELVLSQNEN